MERMLKTTISRLLSSFNIRVTRLSTFEKLIANVNAVNDLEFLKSVKPKFRSDCIDNLKLSRSQLRQDLFVLSELGFKKNGFFVEFGATNGVDLSNSVLLEKEFGWKGILAEPATGWHAELMANRNVHIETNCVWKSSGEKLTFKEIGELSTIETFSNYDNHKEARRNSIKYSVDTISLEDLLVKYDAPKNIDYLSIDTEGSEFEILGDFDFKKYNFKIITCEHNFTSNREKIYKLLTKNGYVRKFEQHSQFDDWYVLS